ncbi:MAG: hypothetical protein FWF85_02255 [Clostridiales bacterium]|jgi:ssDNA-binding Zn-finger/Zn-ribbon topoisomerase 1|nr:hypothetical protein [Clostridiales bacterium]MDR2713295.1 hypothetical protein [Clostridiales bacterium]
MADTNLNNNERDILSEANRDFIEYGSTIKKCPRCGKPLVYQIIGTKEITRCSDGNCIMLLAVGI